MDINLRVVFARLARALLIVTAVLISLPLVGIDLTMLSVFSGALGVGLGLGLQKIASNYVSGFIILLDRSIRIGNLISVGTAQRYEDSGDHSGYLQPGRHDFDASHFRFGGNERVEERYLC
jgi:small-conductance mechanosensitive channel